MSRQSGRKHLTALTIDPPTLVTSTPTSEHNENQMQSFISYQQNMQSNKRGKIDPVLSLSHLTPMSPIKEFYQESTLSPHLSRPACIVQYIHAVISNEPLSMVSLAGPHSIAGNLT